MQYTAIFHGCKNSMFRYKNCDIFSYFFSLKTEIMCSTEDLRFGAKKKKKETNVYLCKPQFYYIELGCNAVYMIQTYSNGNTILRQKCTEGK